MSKIVYIADPEVLAIPIVENHEPLVDIKTDPRIAYGPPPECPETETCYTKMRRTVYEKYLAAQASLPTGWKFRLYEGFRSIEVQQFLFSQMWALTKSRQPQLNEADLFHETTRLVSPVNNFDGTQNIPAHNTGAAVDVEILDAEGRVVDMGMEAKDWLDVEPELCNTDCRLISAAQQENRRILFDAMIAQGFVNYPTEWWHFSYGDRYWAYQQKQNYAIYGSVC